VVLKTGNEDFNEQSRLENSWRNDVAWKQNILTRVYDLKENTKTQIISIESEDWDELVSKHCNKDKTKFLTAFDDKISFKLQECGYKCWLRSVHNRFLKDGTWHGNS
jgi:hypothetical protein